jgi:hypothetical protein
LTLQELERSLPNGLHDAELVKVHVDYASQETVLELNLDVSKDEKEEGKYRRARLTFSGVQFVSIDAPANENAVGVSTIDAGPGQPPTSPRPLPKIPKDCFLCWLFVVRWNSFIRIAAKTAVHQWIDSDRGPPLQL